MTEDLSYLYTLLALAGIWGLVVISPGPCFVATVQRTMAGSRMEGFFVALGVATGTVIWCAASLLGLEIIFAKFNWLYQFVRGLGIAYLVYLGLKLILTAHRPLEIEPGDAREVRYSAAWRQGLLTDLSNPKAAVFFTSLFAALLPPNAPFWVMMTAVSIIVIAEFIWYCLLSYFMSLKQVTALYQRIKKWIDYITGGALMLFAARLAAK